MIAPIPFKKLVGAGIITSIAFVSALALAPHVFTFRQNSINTFFQSVFIFAAIIACGWMMNVIVLFATERLIPQKRRQLLRYILSYGSCLFIIFALRQRINSFVHDTRDQSAHLYVVFVLAAILNTIILIAQDLILLRERKTKTDLENAELRIKHMEAMNLHLKHQIHPHFLFNSLTTLKSLIKKDVLLADDYLSKLAELLRVGMLANMPNTILLQEEVKLCVDYLAMQKVRFGAALQYRISIPENAQYKEKVLSFSLISLIENAIKHNSFTVDDPLLIEINYDDGFITVVNNTSRKQTLEPSTGLGLKNLDERYRLINGGSIEIIKTSESFTVRIKTIAYEDRNN